MNISNLVAAFDATGARILQLESENTQLREQIQLLSLKDNGSESKGVNDASTG